MKLTEAHSISNNLELYNSSILKKIMGLAWPVVAEMFLTTITQMVDMAMVGRLGREAVAAIGLSIQPLYFGQGLFSAVGVGTVAIVARNIGAGNKSEANNALNQSLIIALIMSLVYTTLLIAFAKPIYVFLKAETVVLDLGIDYLKYLIPGLLLMFINMVLISALRGAGDTKTPMRVNIIINIVNVIANYIFIFGFLFVPAYGVKGAAIATSLARIIGTFILFSEMLKGKLILSLDRKLQIQKGMILRILKIGLPATIEQLIMRLAMISYVRIISSLGTVYFATYQIAYNAESISYMPGFGFSVAATVLVSQNLGAGKLKESMETGLKSWKLGMSIMGFMGIIIFFFARQIMLIYTSDLEIIEIGTVCLQIVAFCQLPTATAFVLSGALRGVGDTKFILMVSMVATWVFRLGSAYLFIYYFNMGIYGAYYAMIVDWSFRGILSYWRFKGGKWTSIKI
jgi:putative MATE family efflux protein